MASLVFVSLSCHSELVEGWRRRTKKEAMTEPLFVLQIVCVKPLAKSRGLVFGTPVEVSCHSEARGIC